MKQYNHVVARAGHVQGALDEYHHYHYMTCCETHNVNATNQVSSPSAEPWWA